MPVVTRTFPVTPAPSAVVQYLSDFANAEHWDPGTVTCTRNDSGPIVVGSTWHNTSKIAGVSTELTYTLREFGAGRLVFVGENKTATSTDTITVEADGTGSSVTYRADIQMHGAAKLTDPVVKLVFERIGNKTVEQMTETLNGLS